MNKYQYKTHCRHNVGINMAVDERIPVHNTLPDMIYGKKKDLASDKNETHLRVYRMKLRSHYQAIRGQNSGGAFFYLSYN